jgi:serine phosphatase RsbU (regulator of sigma subunit)
MFKHRLTFLFAFVFLLQAELIRSQGLQPVCQNYNTIDYIEDLEFHSAVEDNRGTIYFATNFGVLIYKGERKSQAKGWDFLLLPEPDIIYSLYFDSRNNRLYVGGETQMGYFELKNYFTGTYTSLNEKRSEEAKNTPVWHINKVNNSIVFHTVKALLVYENGNLKSIPAPAESIFHNVFEIEKGKLLINTITKGWYVFDGKLSPLKGSEQLPQDKCYGVLPSLEPEHWQFFYRNEGVFKAGINDKSISGIEKISTPAFDKFLSETQLYAVQYSARSQYLVLATLNKGAFIVSTNRSHTTEMLDLGNIVSETSASTNIKSAMGLFFDKQKNTWILGKTNLSIVPSDLSMFFNELAGVTVLDMCTTRNETLIATENGLFKLSNEFHTAKALSKISEEVYKKIESKGDSVFCLRDFGLNIYTRQKMTLGASELFLNDFCITDKDMLIATESGLISSGKGKIVLEKENILQVVEWNNNYYVISEEQGVKVLDNTLKVTTTIPYNKHFKTLNLARLFVYNSSIILRNVDNTFKLENNTFVPLDPDDARKVWAHGAISLPPTNDQTEKGKPMEFTFEYDGQNNTYLYLTTTNETYLANSFKSSVEINDIVSAGSSYLVGTKSGLFLSPLYITGKPEEKVHIFNFVADSIQYELESEIFIPYNKSKNIDVFFSLSGFYNKADNTSYKYRLIGYDSLWKDNYLTRLQFSHLPPGNYTLEIKANYGNALETPTSYIQFIIGKPWWQTWWAIALLVLSTILLIYAIVQLSIYRLKKSKIKLEKIVTERTLEIATQKNEIEHKNKEITDSINYAKRIQSALLTDENYLQETFPNAFVLYIPKDIVSGDYYWFNNINGIECIVVADCTGHGVPGAFMSMLGVAKLNEIKAENIHQPDRMLNRLNRLIFETLGQGKPNTDSRDGMDMSIITIDRQNNRLQYAGANRNLIIVNRENKTHEEIKPTKLPVGGSQYGPDRDYEMHSLPIQKGYSYFLSTDGYADQFGGPNGKKFMTKKLNELYIQVSSASSQEQKQILTDTYLAWKQNVEQVDDVCIFGISF